jgi:porphobilinogen synthase
MIPTQAAYPATRFRRTRQSPAIRALTQENTLTVGNLI